MKYLEYIRQSLEDHLAKVQSISLTDSDDSSTHKIQNHLSRTIEVYEQVDEEKPQNLRILIEYLNSEGRNFGWSFSENKSEEICENSFWDLSQSLQKIVEGMSTNERLHYFGYLDEFNNIPPNHMSAKQEILLKLFIKN